ncbi:hypothetical protein E4656_04345 [Natronospirillum operosum]|uniref:Uncharacterized protein n=1 Tax=Natronospirillum operosum TaxID=2759953 RepID=A0A4Z0WGC1_9GAMM|nr:hypothetical protein [Natronospirillum operosum]TGG95648.1 hypothetical protein E4656_04345 [Natronospirillum operosum]
MYWEIIELEDGDIALVREDEEEPVLTIGFSAEAKERLASNHMEVAKAMIGAGMDAVEHFTLELEESEEETLMAESRDAYTVIH